MSFIDSTYFIGEINVPQASDNTSLTQAISQYEKEILISLLGYKLYSLLMADCTNDVPSDQIYLDLVNGAEFDHVYNGETYTLKWEGLKNSLKTSLISYFVFYNFVKRDITSYYGTGMSVAPSGKDWQRANPSFKLVDVWERMRELYGKFPPQFKRFYNRPIQGSEISCSYNMDASALNFLIANKDNYPDWVFTPLWNQNAFGI